MSRLTDRFDVLTGTAEDPAIALLLDVAAGLDLDVSVQHVGIDCYIATLEDGRFYDCGLPIKDGEVHPQAEQMIEIGMRRELINGAPNSQLMELWVASIEEQDEVPVAEVDPIG